MHYLRLITSDYLDFDAVGDEEVDRYTQQLIDAIKQENAYTFDSLMHMSPSQTNISDYMDVVIKPYNATIEQLIADMASTDSSWKGVADYLDIEVETQVDEWEYTYAKRAFKAQIFNMVDLDLGAAKVNYFDRAFNIMKECQDGTTIYLDDNKEELVRVYAQPSSTLNIDERQKLAYITCPNEKCVIYFNFL